MCPVKPLAVLIRIPSETLGWISHRLGLRMKRQTVTTAIKLGGLYSGQE